MTGFGKWLKDTVFRIAGAHNRLSSQAYIEYARDKGCRIGEGTQFFGEKKLDLSRGSMIDIGENCVITDRVRLLTHTWDQPLLQRRFGDEDSPEYESIGEVNVGNNVFIGENSFVLPSVEIGDNTIIGAGSVVTSDIPAESVAVGNPCRVVMSLEEYRKRRLDRENERLRTYLCRCDQRGVEPDPDVCEIINNSEIDTNS